MVAVGALRCPAEPCWGGWRGPVEVSPPTESMSESETWVMENRDTGAGETVKRENWRGSTCFGAGASVGTAGSGSAGVSEDIRDGFTGMSGKSSSHSKPPPVTQSAGPGAEPTIRVTPLPPPTPQPPHSLPRRCHPRSRLMRSASPWGWRGWWGCCRLGAVLGAVLRARGCPGSSARPAPA